MPLWYSGCDTTVMTAFTLHRNYLPVSNHQYRPGLGNVAFVTLLYNRNMAGPGLMALVAGASTLVMVKSCYYLPTDTRLMTGFTALRTNNMICRLTTGHLTIMTCAALLRGQP